MSLPVFLDALFDLALVWFGGAVEQGGVGGGGGGGGGGGVGSGVGLGVRRERGDGGIPFRETGFYFREGLLGEEGFLVEGSQDLLGGRE